MKISYYDINGKIFHQKFSQPLIRMGREPHMDLYLVDPTVSGTHASISKLGDKYFINDLGSTNGTKLNGTLVNKAILQEGDHIQLGEFSLWFELPPAQTPQRKIIDLELITKKSIQSTKTP